MKKKSIVSKFAFHVIYIQVNSIHLLEWLQTLRNVVISNKSGEALIEQ